LQSIRMPKRDRDFEEDSPVKKPVWKVTFMCRHTPRLENISSLILASTTASAWPQYCNRVLELVQMVSTCPSVQREGSSAATYPPGYEIPDGWLNCPPYGHNLRPNKQGAGMIPCKVHFCKCKVHFCKSHFHVCLHLSGSHPKTICYLRRSRLEQNSADTSLQRSSSHLHTWSSNWERKDMR